uniref:ATP synthase subunit a n=1 Tax=Ochterus marginatus TaxID=280162 RepID=C5HIV6_9HEMI|nr:ATP synthase F0 subunit 6 [Ochterus marginatus]
MMTNLFSTFDPATSLKMSLNWISTFTIMMMIPPIYWIIPTQYSMMFSIMLYKMHNEFKMLLSTNNSGFTLMLNALFLFILFNNLMGLLPYIFTSSSHMSFTMSMAIPMWTSLMLFGWINKTQDMLAHLIPSGTPTILMPFMVCIETISNIIRPGSLAVRLTANMIAGHLLMSLIGNKMANTSNILLIFMILSQMGLMMFEAAVAIIQAYVFSVLSTLYTSEVS